MIKVIGAKRTGIILALVVLNSILAALVYMMIAPASVNAQQSLQTTTTQVATARSEAERLRGEISEITKQKAEFEKLSATGFFTPQDRVMARQRFEAIQRYSRVLLATYDIEPVEVERSEELTAAGQVILKSPVNVSVDSLDDLDFYNFVFLLNNAFPGHSSIDSIEVQRVQDLNDVVLRQIGSGSPTALVRGSVKFTWKTMVPESQLQAGTDQAAGM